MDKLNYESINEEQEREFEQHQTVCQDIELRAMRVKIDELVTWVKEHEGKGHPGPKGKSKYMRK